MLSQSFGVIFKRDVSFFSRKTAQIIKEAINPPKKSSNAYALFYQEKYPEIKREDLKMTEVSVIVANKWRESSPEQKQIYSKKAQEIKNKYAEDKEEFTKSLTNHEKVALSLLKLNNKAQKGELKRSALDPAHKEFLSSLPESMALTARGAFLSQKLKGTSVSPMEQSQKLSEAMNNWANISKTEQDFYENLAQKNLSLYQSKIKEFLKMD